MIEGSEYWESLLEVNPLLGQCRVILQLRQCMWQQHMPAATDKAEGVQPPPKRAVPGHRGWTAQLSCSGGMLQLLLLHPPCREPVDGGAAKDKEEPRQKVSPFLVNIFVGNDVTVSSDCLRSYEDHLCLLLHLQLGSAWPANVATRWGGAIVANPIHKVHELTCRRCQQQLVPMADNREIMPLPTHLWEACADSLACEECTPLGSAHLRPAQGRVYTSAQSLLVNSADLSKGAVDLGADNFARCATCGSVVGEVERAPQQGRLLARPRIDRTHGRQGSLKGGLCVEGWTRGATACKAKGVSLYKHRVSMPSFDVVCAALSDNDVNDETDALGSGFSEAAAVAGQLLVLLRAAPDGAKSARCSSRFMLLPTHPDFADEDKEVADASAEALDLRIMVRELVVVGPQPHWAEVTVKDPLDALQQYKPSSVPPAWRMTRVCYRRRPCAVQVPAQTCTLVVPQCSFAAVCSALDEWAELQPASHGLAPVARDAMGSWRTSLLPLPPREQGDLE